MDSLALLEVGNLSPALIVVDRCAKAAGVRVVGVESADPVQCIKLLGSADAVKAAAEAGVALAKRMGAAAAWSVLAGPLPETLALAQQPPAFNPLAGRSHPLVSVRPTTS